MIEDTSVLPKIIWRCPICHAEDSLKASASGIFTKKWTVACSACGARWEDVGSAVMTLTQGPAEFLGKKSLDEWSEMASGKMDLDTIDVAVPILLDDGEEPVRVAQVMLCKNRTRRQGGIVGASYPVGSLRLYAGQMVGNEVTELKVIDQGDLILTTSRLVFNGADKVVDMKLAKIVAVDVEEGLLEVGYASSTHRFHFPDQSPLKWQIFVSALARGARNGDSKSDA